MRPTAAGLIAAVVWAAAGAATAAPIEVGGPPPDMAGAACDVRVEFASTAAGINRAAFERIARFVERRRDVSRARQWNWGREGERTLCLNARSRQAGVRVFRAIASMRFPNPNGAITTVERNGRKARLDRAPRRPM